MSRLFLIRMMLGLGYGLTDVSARLGIPANVIDRALWVAIDHSQVNEDRGERYLQQAPRYEVVA